LFSPALAEDEQRKRRRNKKERGGSLFSLRKKKDKKEGVKGLAKVRKLCLARAKFYTVVMRKTRLQLTLGRAEAALKLI
jgi:hypothetical protein